MNEWKPQIGDRFIWHDRATLICTRRIVNPTTGKRCLVGRNATGSGYLDGEFLEFDQCRPYWEPQPGDRVLVASASWSKHQGKKAIVKGYIITQEARRFADQVYGDRSQEKAALGRAYSLAQLIFENGGRWDCQHVWLRALKEGAIE